MGCGNFSSLRTLMTWIVSQQYFPDANYLEMKGLDEQIHSRLKESLDTMRLGCTDIRGMLRRAFKD